MQKDEEYQPTLEDVMDFNNSFNANMHYTPISKYANISKRINVRTELSKVLVTVYHVTINNKSLDLTKAALVNIIQSALMGFDDIAELSRQQILDGLSLLGITEDHIRIAIDPDMSDSDWNLLKQGKEYPYIMHLWNAVFDSRHIVDYNERLASWPYCGKCLPYPIFLDDYNSLDYESWYTRKLLIAFTDPSNRPMYHLSDNKLLQESLSSVKGSKYSAWFRDLFDKLQYYDALGLFRLLYGMIYETDKEALLENVTIYPRGLELLLFYFGHEYKVPVFGKHCGYKISFAGKNVSTSRKDDDCNPPIDSSGTRYFNEVALQDIDIFAIKEAIRKRKDIITQKEFMDIIMNAFNKIGNLTKVCRLFTIDDTKSKWAYWNVRNARERKAMKWNDSTFKKLLDYFTE